MAERSIATKPCASMVKIVVKKIACNDRTNAVKAKSEEVNTF